MKKVDKTYNQVLEKIALFMTVTFISVIPLLIRIYIVNYPMNEYSWFDNQSTFIDTYSLFRSWVIILLGTIAGATLLYQQIKCKTLSMKDPVVITTLVLFSLTLLSYFTSINKSISSMGYLERSESVWVWLSYFLVFLLIYSVRWTSKNLKIIISSFVITNVLMSLIGLLQYFGVHILFSEWFKPFITSRELTNASIEGLYSIDYKVILQTLSHYNYVGYFITLSLPVTIALLIYEQNIKLKVFYGLLSVLILFNLFGSTARGGLLGILVSIPFLLFINRHKLIKNRKVAITLILMFTVVFIGFEIISGGFVTMRIKSTFTSIETANILQDVVVEEDTIRFNITDKLFEIKVVSAVDAEWDVQFKLDDVIIKPVGLDEKGALYFEPTVLLNVKNYITSAEDQYLYTVDIYGTPWYFGYSDDKLTYINVYGKPDSIIRPDSIGFEGKEKLGSARGYIWSRSFPLIINKPLLGYGPDTFALAFPQSDYVGKYNAYNTTNMVVDKAHNTFIQIAINSGVFALLAYVVLHIILAVRMISYFVKNKFNATSIYHSIFSSVVLGYFIASFFNDSTVQVSPTYWGLLGLSFIIFETRKESMIDS